MKPTVTVVGTLAAENGAAHMFPHPSVAREGDYLVAILGGQIGFLGQFADQVLLVHGLSFR